MGKVPVYRKDTGERVYVPEHWVGHKVLGRQFRKTAPSATPSGRTTTAPASGDTTQKES